MSFISIYHWATNKLKHVRGFRCDDETSTIPHDGTDEQLLYGLVVQKLAEFYNIEAITWETVIRQNRSEGMIGNGQSNPRLHLLLKQCKVCQVHAIFHDAMGFLYKTYGVGNGYDILFGCLPACPLAGQVSGLLYSSYQCMRRRL